MTCVLNAGLWNVKSHFDSRLSTFDNDKIISTPDSRLFDDNNSDRLPTPDFSTMTTQIDSRLFDDSESDRLPTPDFSTVKTYIKWNRVPWKLALESHITYLLFRALTHFTHEQFYQKSKENKIEWRTQKINLWPIIKRLYFRVELAREFSVRLVFLVMRIDCDACYTSII